MQYTHNPILVTLTRGAITESVHRGAFALVDASGNTRLAVGDVLRPIYPRSAVKPLQALALVETGDPIAAAAIAVRAGAVAVGVAGAQPGMPTWQDIDGV